MTLEIDSGEPDTCGINSLQQC